MSPPLSPSPSTTTTAVAGVETDVDGLAIRLRHLDLPGRTVLTVALDRVGRAAVGDLQCGSGRLVGSRAGDGVITVIARATRGGDRSGSAACSQGSSGDAPRSGTSFSCSSGVSLALGLRNVKRVLRSRDETTMNAGHAPGISIQTSAPPTRVVGGAGAAAVSDCDRLDDREAEPVPPRPGRRRPAEALEGVVDELGRSPARGPRRVQLHPRRTRGPEPDLALAVRRALSTRLVSACSRRRRSPSTSAHPRLDHQRPPRLAGRAAKRSRTAANSSATWIGLGSSASPPSSERATTSRSSASWARRSVSSIAEAIAARSSSRASSVAQRELELGLVEGERRAQLVAGVVDEARSRSSAASSRSSISFSVSPSRRSSSLAGGTGRRWSGPRPRSRAARRRIASTGRSAAAGAPVAGQRREQQGDGPADQEQGREAGERLVAVAERGADDDDQLAAAASDRRGRAAGAARLDPRQRRSARRRSVAGPPGRELGRLEHRPAA